MIIIGCCHAAELIGAPASSYPFPIALKGPHYLSGFRTEKIAAYSLFKSGWRRIALQIDEVNKRGDYVLEGGLPFTANSDDGYFDDNDEVVLYGRDIGEAINLKAVPAKYTKDALGVWRVNFKSGRRSLGDVLFVAHNDLPTTEVLTPAVSFDANDEVVATNTYRYSFHKQRAALLGQVEVKSLQTNKWESVFEESQFLLSLRLPWYLPNFNFDDKNFTSTIESWRIGPVRTIVAVGAKLNGFLSLFDFHMFSELVFYENSLEIPTLIEFTFDPASHFKTGSGIVYGIKMHEGLKLDLETNLASLPEAGPDGLATLEKSAAEYPFFFAKAKNAGREVYVKVRVDQKATKEIPPPFLISEQIFQNDDVMKRWDWADKVTGDLGVFIDFSRVRQGSYEFGLDLILLSEADERTLTDYKSVATEWSVLATR